jgi:hypothetical protein
MAHFFVGKYELSLHDLYHAKSYLPSDDEPEKEKLIFCIHRAEKGLHDQDKALLKRKQALQRAFNSTSPSTEEKAQDITKVAREKGWTRQRILLAVSMVCILALAVFAATLQKN